MLVFKDVRHILELCFNLISFGELIDERYSNVLGNVQWKLIRGSFMMLREKKCCTLYAMHSKLYTSEVNTDEIDSSLELWHRKVGHMNEKESASSCKG